MRITLPTGTEAEVAGDPTARGLVLVPDIMGLRPLFDDLVARLASRWQCRVCAPDLYAGQTHLDLAGRFEAASLLDDTDVLADMVAAADIASGDRASGDRASGDRASGDRIGAIGFCMGGMYVTKAASTGRFDRLVPFYGMIRVPGDWAGSGQGQPLDHLAEGDASSLMAVIGTADPYTPPDDVAALAAAGATIAAYEGAEHAFVHDAGRPSHRAEDAADAWRRTESWLWA